MEWKEYRLGQILEIHDKLRKPLSSIERESFQGEYPYYGAQGAIDNVREYRCDGTFMLVAEDGENLSSRIQPIARIATGKFWVNNHAHIVKTNEHADLKYICYLLNCSDISGYVTGTAQPKLSQENLCRISVALPPFCDQQKIVSILSNYDTLIDINTKRIKLFEDSARELYKEWFVRMRFPGHEQTKFVKGIPEGWVVGRLNDISTLVSQKVNSNDVPIYITTDNMLKEFKGIDYTNIENKPEGRVSSFGKGDILLSNIRPYFKKLWYANQQGGCSADVLVIRANKDVDTHFLYYTLSTDNFIDHVMAGANGTKMPRGNKAFTMNYPLLIPKKNVMDLFHNKISPIYSAIETLQLQNQSLTATRDRLLPRLLSGELKINA